MISTELSLAEGYLQQAKVLLAQSARTQAMNRSATVTQENNMVRSLVQETIKRLEKVLESLGGEVANKNDGY